MDGIRAHVFVYGDVIDVGFRFWTVREARRLGLRGWVKNLDDCVEAVFEGEKEKVEKMVSKCHEGPLISNVERVEVKYTLTSGEFSDFSILK